MKIIKKREKPKILVNAHSFVLDILEISIGLDIVFLVLILLTGM